MATQDLPTPPFVEVQGIANFRDIGGIAARDNTVKKGLVYRSADPTKATDEGLKRMSEELGMVGCTTMIMCSSN